MQLDELERGQSVLIQVVIDATQHEFPTEIIETPKGQYVLAAPIFKQGKIISFQSEKIITNLIVNIPNEKPHIFFHVKVRALKTSNGQYMYQIITDSPSREFNRRGAFRCYIGLPTSIRIGVDHRALETTIKDISLSGFSFVMPYGADSYNAGEQVHTVLNEFINEKKMRFSMHLFGVIVRKEELDNGNNVYGCRLTSPVAGLEKYIMLKERLSIAKSRGM